MGIGQAVEQAVAVAELAVDISGDNADVAVADTVDPAHIVTPARGIRNHAGLNARLESKGCATTCTLILLRILEEDQAKRPFCWSCMHSFLCKAFLAGWLG